MQVVLSHEAYQYQQAKQNDEETDDGNGDEHGAGGLDEVSLTWICRVVMDQYFVWKAGGLLLGPFSFAPWWKLQARRVDTVADKLSSVDLVCVFD